LNSKEHSKIKISLLSGSIILLSILSLEKFNHTIVRNNRKLSAEK